MNKQEYYDWLERKRIVSQAPNPKNTGMEHANYLVNKTMQLFNMVQTVKVCTSQDLLDYLGDFSPNEEGCKKWVVGQKFREKWASINSRSKDSFLKIGSMAKEYFGEDLVKKCWKEHKPVHHVMDNM